jgi:hypothetical protein
MAANPGGCAPSYITDHHHRRLLSGDHLHHGLLANDSLFARFCGLSRISSDRTVVNWLKQFTQTSLRALDAPQQRETLVRRACPQSCRPVA